MAEPTPGPWEARKTIYEWPWRIFASGMEKDPLEDSMLAAVFPGHYDKQRDEANARLIAAAPALLDALRGLVLRAEGLTELAGGYCVACRQLRGCHKPLCEIAIARAALAAAVGDAGKEAP